MKNKNKKSFPAKYVLFLMAVLCIALIFGSIRFSTTSNILNTAAGYVIIPMQKGINQIGTAMADLRQQFTSKEELLRQNEELQAKLNNAQEELTQVQLNQQELTQLRELYEMDMNYSDYDKLAANVIGKDSGNWFSVFLIDKGTDDGVTAGMNIIANGGLAGIVTDAGRNYATVRSVIDDNSNISCMDLANENLCIVSGSLKSMNEGSVILFSEMSDSENTVSAGDQIVTSNISDLYLPGIPVGYITEITEDSNQLTKSGKLAVITDFEHMNKVFVILQKKDTTGGTKGE